MNRYQKTIAIVEQKRIMSEAQVEINIIEETGQGWEDWNGWSDKFNNAKQEIKSIETQFRQSKMSKSGGNNIR